MLTNSKLANIFIEASRDLGLSMDPVIIKLWVP